MTASSLRSFFPRARRIACTVLLAAGAIGCSSGVAPRTPPPLPTATEAVKLVQRVRGLQAKRPIRVEWVTEAELRARVAKQVGEERERKTEATPSALRTLVEDEDGATFDQAATKGVGGYFDPDTDTIVVPHPEPDATRIGTLSLLAHEIEHAIVEQHFPQAEMPAGNLDARLAQQALREGDAHATMAAVVASDEGVPVDRGLLGLASDTRLHGLSIALGDHGSRLHADHAAFAYQRGLEFVADLHRVGGFELVDRALREPPVSTAQILEPQRFLDGHLPVPVQRPTAEGALKDSLVLGAKRLSDLLHRCRLELSRSNAAAGWDGDRLSMLASGDVLLVTTWRTDADAQRFERGAGSLAACLAQGRSVAVERRERDVVALASQAPSKPLVAAAFASIGERAAERPLVALRIPPRPVGATRGIVQNGVFRSDWLGLRFTLPPRAEAAMNVTGLELQLKSPDYVAWLSLYKRPATPAGMSRTLSELEGEVRKGMRLDLLPYSNEREQTPLGLAYRRTYHVARSNSRILIEIVPICRGNGAVVLVLHASEQADETLVMEHWRTVQRTSASPPVCSGLDL